MPALTYPSADFTPFTKILSADVNAKFTAIATLLNTTKLDSTNVQQYGLTRDRLAAGTASQILVNDLSGNMSSVATIGTTQGGTGLAYTPVLADAQKVLRVDPTGTGFEIGTAPEAGTLKILTVYRFY